jgi:hypothetical protein
MKTEPLRRGIVKNSDGVHPNFPNELGQFLSARIAEKIRSKKNIALLNLA